MRISPQAIEVLREQKRKTNDTYVFPSLNGGPISPDSVNNMLGRVLERAGIPKVRFHDLRHTFATIALQNGVDIKTVSGMLGHFSAGFTLDTYAHVTTSAQKEAAQTMGNVLSIHVNPTNKLLRRDLAIQIIHASLFCYLTPIKVFINAQHEFRVHLLIALHLIDMFDSIAPYFKHSFWREECETRALLSIKTGSKKNKDLGTYPDGSKYYDLSISGECISKVILGPEFSNDDILELQTVSGAIPFSSLATEPSEGTNVITNR